MADRTTRSPRSGRNRISESHVGYLQSVNLEFDLKNPDELPPFTFSERSLAFLTTLLDSFDDKSRDRAWSVIGPYGSGKSLFATFIHELTRESVPGKWLSKTLSGLEIVAPDVAQRIKTKQSQGDLRFLFVPVSGTRSRLSVALIRALARVCTGDGVQQSWVSQAFLKKVLRHRELTETGMEDALGLAELYAEAAGLAKAAGHRGILLAIDEFGQFLERASANYETGSLIAAQYLAEAAARSKDAQFQFLVLLHQGISHYANSLPEVDQIEWTKIQARFREIPFAEYPDNQYQLILDALAGTRTNIDDTAQAQWAARVWDQVKALPPFVGPGAADYWTSSVSRFFPLHPLAVFALPRLASLAAQNERTLFAFLRSGDPLGFKTFIRDVDLGARPADSLTLDRLYDYFLRSPKSAFLPSDVRRRVSEAEAALDRLDDRPQIDSRVVKAIAVLNLLERGTQLRTSQESIAAALDISATDPESNLGPTLEHLIALRLITYRSFANDYRLWHGADFDIDSAVSAARRTIPSEYDLTQAVASHALLRPVVARRHSMETGTVRAFAWRLVTVTQLMEGGQRGPVTFRPATGGIDGIIVLILPRNAEEIDWAARWAATYTNPTTLVIVPSKPVQLVRRLVDLAAISRLDADQTSPNDPVIARELRSRAEVLEVQIRFELESLLTGAIVCSAFRGGRKRDLSSQFGLGAQLSGVCDEIFDQAPKLRNELINRDDLSSATILACKKIIGALLEGRSGHRLNFEGNGPEVSIFRSLFEDTKIWRADRSKTFRFVDPRASHDPCRLRPAWKAVADGLENSRRTDDPAASPFPPLLANLSSPPLGLRRAPALMLVWAFMLGHRDRVALYDNGTFLTDWSVEHFDRFCKHPESFSARWFSPRGRPSEFLQDLAACIPASGQNDAPTSLAGFLRLLYGWYRALPSYSLQTREVPEAAIRLRRELATAVDPIELISARLPQAFGLAVNRTTDSVIRRELLNRLRDAVEALSGTYPALLTELVGCIHSVLGWGPTINVARTQCASIPQSAVDRVRDPSAKAFLIRSRVAATGDVEWLESLAAALVGQSPKFWLDHQKEEFTERLAIVSKELQDAKQRAVLGNLRGSERLVRVTFESANGVFSDQLLQERGLLEDQILAKLWRALCDEVQDDSSKRAALASALFARAFLEAPIGSPSGGPA